MKKILKVLLVLIITILSISVVSAHSGRTDSKGGHKDKNNVSGLGPYHYHCGGYPAHLHPNGVCPYTTNSVSGQATPEPINVPASKPEIPKVQAPSVPKQYCCYTTDKAFVNGEGIQLYTLNGEIYVKCSDLNDYGFDVSYDSDISKVVIKRNTTKEINPHEVISYPDGKGAYEVIDTNIKVYVSVNGVIEEIPSFNGYGNMFAEFKSVFKTEESEGIIQYKTGVDIHILGPNKAETMNYFKEYVQDLMRKDIIN